ncbi:MAG: MFS transporter [Thermoplasmataceae archaeon]|jgi:MFS family permease
MSNKTFIAMRSFVIAVGATAASTFIGVYGVLLGATVVEMGWLQSITNAVNNGGQLLWGRISDRVGSRKPFLLLGGVVLGALWYLLTDVRTPVELILVYAIISLFSALITVNWFSLLADSSTVKTRGRFLSTVNNLSSIGTILSLVIMTFTFSGAVSNQIRIPFYLAASTYFVSLVLIWRIRETKRSNKSQKSLLNTLKNIRNEPLFFKYFMAMNAQGFFWSMAWPMFPITIVTIMNFSLKDVAILTVTSSVAALCIQFVLGRIVDRMSRPPLIFLNRLLLSLIPLQYAFYVNLKEFIILEIYSGIISSIQNVVMNSYLLDIVPENGRGEYISLINGFNGIMYLVGALSGGYLLDYFTRLFPLREALLAGYIVVFFGRFLSSLLFIGLKEPENRKGVPLSLYNVLLRRQPAGSPSGGTIRVK